MNKLVVSLFLGLLVSVSCGKSQQEKEAEAKLREDSLNAAESAMKAAEAAARVKAMADSTKLISAQDSSLDSTAP